MERMLEGVRTEEIYRPAGVRCGRGRDRRRRSTVPGDPVNEIPLCPTPNTSTCTGQANAASELTRWRGPLFSFIEPRPDNDRTIVALQDVIIPFLELSKGETGRSRWFGQAGSFPSIPSPPHREHRE
jgi:hypothetical protein